MPKIISIQVVDRKVETRDGVESYETIYGLGEDSKIYIWDEVEADWYFYGPIKKNITS
jgi:hypothetical protein